MGRWYTLDDIDKLCCILMICCKTVVFLLFRNDESSTSLQQMEWDIMHLTQNPSLKYSLQLPVNEHRQQNYASLL